MFVCLFFCLLAFFFCIMSDKDDSSYISDFVAFPSHKVSNTTTTVVPDIVNLVEPAETADMVDVNATAGKAGTTNTKNETDRNNTNNADNTNNQNNVASIPNTPNVNNTHITMAVKMEMNPVTPSPAKKPPRMSFVDESTVDLLFDEVLKAEIYLPKDQQTNKRKSLTSRWREVAAVLQIKTNRTCSERACKDNVEKHVAFVRALASRDSVDTALMPKHKAHDKIVQVMDLKDSLKQASLEKAAEKTKLDETSNSLRKQSAMRMVDGFPTFVSPPMKLGEDGVVKDDMLATASPMPTKTKTTRSSSPRLADIVGKLLETRATSADSTLKTVMEKVKNLERDTEIRLYHLERQVSELQTQCICTRKRKGHSLLPYQYDSSDSEESYTPGWRGATLRKHNNKKHR